MPPGTPHSGGYQEFQVPVLRTTQAKLLSGELLTSVRFTTEIPDHDDRAMITIDSTVVGTSL